MRHGPPPGPCIAPGRFLPSLTLSAPVPGQPVHTRASNPPLPPHRHLLKFFSCFKAQLKYLLLREAFADCSKGIGCKRLSTARKVLSQPRFTIPLPLSCPRNAASQQALYTYLRQECGAPPPPPFPHPSRSLFFKTYPSRLSSYVTSSVPHSSQPTVLLDAPAPTGPKYSLLCASPALYTSWRTQGQRHTSRFPCVTLTLGNELG